MYCLGKVVSNLHGIVEERSPFSFGFDRKRPMKTARWWPVAILLLGSVVLGANGTPDKEGFRSSPYRPVVRFRHKVLITVL